MPGTAVATATGVAAAAGEVVAALQRATLGPLPAAPPERQLKSALRKAQLIRAVAPELNVDALARRLHDRLPPAGTLRPSHGDFHVDQLLLGRCGLAVIDFDQLGLAPAALDLATYAADVVRGRATDTTEVHAVLEPLLAGYGERPEALEWHLATAILTRAAHPFQRQAPDWRERVAATLAAAEACLD